MPYATTDDGVRLFYVEAGTGQPIIFAHEFGDNYESWEPQISHFSRLYRCIAYAARGFPPSDVPEDVAKYSQARTVADIGAVMDHLGVRAAHLVGVSMGSFAVLHFALQHPERTLSLAVGSCGHGSDQPDEQRRAGVAKRAAMFDELGAEGCAVKLAADAVRLPYRRKDPRGFLAYERRLAKHSAKGAANVLRGVFMERPTIYSLQDRLQACHVPTLLLAGDEDDPCLKPTLYLKRTMPAAALVVMPWAGHNLNVEDPGRFNRVLEDFLAAVTIGRWGVGSAKATPVAG